MPSNRRDFLTKGALAASLLSTAKAKSAVYKMACLMAPARDDLGYSGKQSSGDATRDNWKSHPFDQFHDGPINGDASTRRTLEMVIASIRE
jgi:hypothetical protein